VQSPDASHAATETEPAITQPPTPVETPAKDVASWAQKLTPEELEAAGRLYMKQRMAKIQTMGGKARSERFESELERVLDAVRESHDGQGRIATMATALNMSPKLLTHHLGELVRRGKVAREGTHTRRQYIVK
jgi:hypothetical protein